MNEKPSPSNESLIVTGRNIYQYSHALFFEPELLRNKKILNLGAGSGNLLADLKKIKIPCSVIELDLLKDPYINNINKFVRTKISHLLNKYLTGDKKIKLIRKIMGTEKRDLVQADMVSLPFPDKSFDIIFALHSTYQLPTEKKQAVFKEMLRVANSIHVNPILKEDLYFFIDLIKTEYTDFNIVLCYLPAHPLLEENKFVITEDQDYQRILNEEFGHSLYEPLAETVSYKKSILGFTHAVIKDGFTIILTRKNDANHE